MCIVIPLTTDKYNLHFSTGIQPSASTLLPSDQLNPPELEYSHQLQGQILSPKVTGGGANPHPKVLAPRAITDDTQQTNLSGSDYSIIKDLNKAESFIIISPQLIFRCHKSLILLSQIKQ